MRRLLEVEKLVHEIGPEETRNIPLITIDELRFIRQIWLDEKHEFDDSLPRIYEEITGKKYDDGTISKNKYFGLPESNLLREVCSELYRRRTLGRNAACPLDIEAKASAMSNKRNVLINFQKRSKDHSFEMKTMRNK